VRALPELRLIRVQAKKTTAGDVLYIHLPKEFVQKAKLEKGDYLIWEIDGRGRLILRKLR
jgi:hypothetical protein